MRTSHLLAHYRYDLLHNAHLNLEGLDELFKVAQVCYVRKIHAQLELIEPVQDKHFL